MLILFFFLVTGKRYESLTAESLGHANSYLTNIFGKFYFALTSETHLSGQVARIADDRFH